MVRRVLQLLYNCCRFSAATCCKAASTVFGVVLFVAARYTHGSLIASAGIS